MFFCILRKNKKINFKLISIKKARRRKDRVVDLLEESLMKVRSLEKEIVDHQNNKDDLKKQLKKMEEKTSINVIICWENIGSCGMNCKEEMQKKMTAPWWMLVERIWW